MTILMYNRDALENMGNEAQIELMKQWFFTLFEDPAHETPYDGREGGYIYTHGGPYDAEEELRKQFEAIVGEEPIMSLVNELSHLGHEWAPTSQYPDYIE